MQYSVSKQRLRHQEFCPEHLTNTSRPRQHETPTSIFGSQQFTQFIIHWCKYPAMSVQPSSLLDLQVRWLTLTSEHPQSRAICSLWQKHCLLWSCTSITKTTCFQHYWFWPDLLAPSLSLIKFWSFAASHPTDKAPPNTNVSPCLFLPQWATS